MPGSKQQNLSVSDSFAFLSQGLKLSLSKECRMYVLIPIAVNLILMSLCGYFLFSYIKDMIFNLIDMVPSFLIFVAYILSALLAFLIICVCCYLFSTVATIIASPFYGLLADKTEQMLTGIGGNDDDLKAMIKDLPRVMKREFRKQMFFIPLALLCLILTFIPVLHVFSPIAWFLLTAWMSCLQYCDYAYDNHKIEFKRMQKDLRRNSLATFSFGAIIAIGLAVPVLNLFLPPAAVCAGTVYYLKIQNRFDLKEQA